jgi:hypothetical protein
MSIRPYAILALTLLAAFARPATLELFRVNWLSADEFSNAGFGSDTGIVRLTLEPSDVVSSFEFISQNNQYRAFLNVVVSGAQGPANGWAIRDMPITVNSPASVLGLLPWNLEIPLPRGMSFAFVRATLTPLPESATFPVIPPGTPTTAIGTTDWIWGGMLLDDATVPGSTGDFVQKALGAPPAPAALNFVRFEKDAPKELPKADIESATDKATGGKRIIKEKDILAVNENVCGCTAGACARSLKYLEAWDTRIDIPAPDDIASVYKDMVKYLKTKEGNGGGTQFKDMKPGLEAYVKDKGLPMEIVETKSPARALDALSKGNDVTLHFHVTRQVKFRGKTFTVSVVAHSAFVVAMQEKSYKDDKGKVHRAWAVEYLDDKNQGDKKASNEKHTLTISDTGKIFQASQKGFPEFAGDGKTVEFILKRYKKPAP